MRGILIGVCLLVACGGEDVETVRDAVTAVCDAFCDRGMECDSTVDERCYDECAAVFCGELDCGDSFGGRQEDIDDCQDAFSSHPCDSEDIPAECNAVIR